MPNAKFNQFDPKNSSVQSEIFNVDENRPSAELNQINPQNNTVTSELHHQLREVQSYIGETARTLRQRAGEHWNKLNQWSTNSFMLRHWIFAHGTMTEPPNFTFKVVKKFSEPMGRQILEALKIIESGSMNLKTEFGSNHLYSLQSSRPEWEGEKAFKEREKEKRETQESV